MAKKKGTSVFYGGKTYTLGKNKRNIGEMTGTKPAGLPGPKTRSQRIKGSKAGNLNGKAQQASRTRAIKAGKGSTFAATGRQSANMRAASAYADRYYTKKGTARQGGATG